MVETENEYLKQITSFFWENGTNPDIEQMEKLSQYSELLVERNERVNLISRKDIDSVIENHVFISAYISKYIPDRCHRFLDIGTGGGLPGIPLAIMRPDMQGVLVDSIGKKVDSVNSFIDKLMLKNITGVNARVESPEFIEEHKNSFDLIVSRGTVPLIVLLRYAFPLINQRGYIFSMKGGDVTDEFKKAEITYKPFIRKNTIFELHYKPSNIRNVKGKKLIMLELFK